MAAYVKNIAVGTTNTVLLSVGTTATDLEQFIMRCTFTNETTGTINMSLFQIPDGGTVGSSAYLLKDIPIEAGDAWVFDGNDKIMMPKGSQLVAIADAVGIGCVLNHLDA